VEDPKIVVTTSHNPSSRLKQSAKVDNTIRLNFRNLEARKSVDYLESRVLHLASLKIQTTMVPFTNNLLVHTCVHTCDMQFTHER